jgi:DNA segregation ATPase FtsK/SpoIIIE-like protein
MNTNLELEKNIESLLSMMSDLYERVHRMERILVDEGTLEPDTPDASRYVAEATQLVQLQGRCSVSFIQKHFKIDYLTAFALLDALEARGVIAPYRGDAERVVNQ